MTLAIKNRTQFYQFFLISFVVGLSFTVFNTFIPSVFNSEFGMNANSIVSAIMLTGFLGKFYQDIWR